jgi:hypothetical protein
MNLKQEAIYRSIWGTRCGRGCGLLNYDHTEGTEPGYLRHKRDPMSES